jgi:hypothetical protein
MLGLAEGREKSGDKITANFLRDLAGQEYVEPVNKPHLRLVVNN